MCDVLSAYRKMVVELSTQCAQAHAPNLSYGSLCMILAAVAYGVSHSRLQAQPYGHRSGPRISDDLRTKAKTVASCGTAI